MKKIHEGKFEVFTTKADAIDKFRQMRGGCRAELSGENRIAFFCQKDGDITITNPPTRHVENENATNLFAKVTEEAGKTYVTYYTTFNKTSNVAKWIVLAIDILTVIFAILFTVAHTEHTMYAVVLILCLAVFTCKLFYNSKEEKNAPNDSEVLVKELEKRVNAVNLWDK